MESATLTNRQLGRATLARQLLLERADVSVLDAVSLLGGLQAQEPKHPFIGLWSRLAGFDEADVREGLHGRSIVRATMMRGTLHLSAATDYAAFRASLQPMLTRAMTSALRDRSEGLDPDAVLPVARELLADQPRTFDELRTLLQAAFPDVNHRALGYAVRMLLPLVMVPTSGDRWGFPRVATFTLAEGWLGCSLDSATEPDELVLHYLRAFGPATAADVQTWSGLQRIKDVLERLRPRLVTFTDERGHELFDLTDAPRPDAGVAAPVRFLPEFDSLLLAHADRARVIADEHRPAVITKNLRVKATFLVDGLVAGRWEVKRSRREATLTLRPFRSLSKRDREALRAEGEAILRFAEPDASALEVTLAEQ